MAWVTPAGHASLHTRGMTKNKHTSSPYECHITRGHTSRFYGHQITSNFGEITMDKASAAARRASRMRNCISVAVNATMSVVVLAGCSSSGGSKSQTGTSGASTVGNTSSTAANVAEAKSLMAKYEAPMTAFSLPPLKSAPPRGKKIALVYNNIPGSIDILHGAEEAVQALGWTSIPIIYDPTTPTGLQEAYAQAVRDNPDGVIAWSVDETAYAQAAKQFAAKHIPVVEGVTADAVTPPVIANVNNADQIALAGRLTAAYVIAQKGADANVAVFNVRSFSILVAYETAFKTEYLRLCPSCKYKSVSVQGADIGTKVPAQVVSTIQTDPKINFAVMGFGNISLGVSAALHSAGVSGVKVVGEAPTTPNISSVLNGSEDMWVGFPIRGMGWTVMDALARYFNNESTAIDTTAPTPFQILTKANAPNPAAQPEVVSYQALFKQLWHVG